MQSTHEAGRPSADDGAPPPRALTELRARRRRISRGLLGGLVALGAVAYVPSVWAALQVGMWSIVVLDTVVYAAVIVVFLHGRLDERVRAATVVTVAAVLGAALSVVFGPNGAGALWLCAVPVLTALLFGRRETLWSLGFVAVALSVVAILRGVDLLAWEMTPGGTLLWLLIAGNAIAISGALALGVTMLIGGLTEAAERTERYGSALAREQAELLEVNDRLERVIAERGRAEARLRQTEKLTAIGTLASGIAHDMNNLLVPIIAGTELLQSGAGSGDTDDDAADRAELLDRTLGAAQAARELVDRILAFSRPASEGREALDATTVFRDAARLLRAALPATVELSFHAEPEAGTILLSNAEAHQILLNLGSNAAHAMPDGGSLGVTLDSVEAGDEPPDVAMPDTGRFVRLMVTDSGVGMEEETLARMFEPFYSRREPSAEPGHGIGLATVHGIVFSAGGFIATHSRPGAGTVMEVFLPLVEDSVARKEPGEAPPSGNGERVLVVDDDEDGRVLAARILKHAGYRAVGITGGAAALRLLDTGEGFDLVLTDLAMPGMDGIEVAEAVRSRHPSIPVLLMSGLVDRELRERAAAVDVAGIIRKPFGVDDLAGAMATALGGRRVSNGSGDSGY